MDSVLNEIVSKWKNTSKKKMFGGTGYLVNGNMVAGILKDNYVLRLGEKNANTAIKLPKIELFNITGRAMKGWVMAKEEAFSTSSELQEWVEKARTYMEKLSPK